MAKKFIRVVITSMDDSLLEDFLVEADQDEEHVMAGKVLDLISNRFEIAEPLSDEQE